MENMKKKLVVYTCITNDYDTLREIPRMVFDSISDSVSFICFTDNPELYSDSKTWTIREIPEDLVRLNKVKAQRILKIAPFRYVDDISDISLWVDSNLSITESPLDLLAKCDLKKYPLWTFKHPQRNCIYDEELAVVRLRKETKEIARAQIEKYMKDKYPTKNGLAETNVILRRHDDLTLKKMSYMWAKEVIDCSHRDQLSFNYCCWKTGLKYGMFDKVALGKVFMRLPHKSPKKLIEEMEKRKREKEEESKEKEIPANIEKPNDNPDVIVSFTTHGKRLKDGIFTKAIDSILKQKTKYKVGIVMTLFKDDLKLLSQSSRKFIDDNSIDLLVAEENLRPHLKYFYAMQKYRTLPIITVDDDCIYEETLVESLMNEHLRYRNCVLAKRVHEITYDDTGEAKPYKKWIYECKTPGAPSFDLCATGVGGVLYPPDILKISYDDLDVIYISLTNDDLFLRKKETSLGVRVKYVPPASRGKSYKLLEAGVDKKEALCLTENTVENDKIIRLLNFNKKDIYNLPIFNSSVQLCEADDVNILYITDSKYLEPTLVSISSIKKYKSKRNYSIYIIGDNLSKNEISKLVKMESPGFSIKMVKIPDNLFDKGIIRQINGVSKSAIYKFFIAELLPHLNKVLYLDGDTIALGCVEELYNKNVDGVYVAAVKDYKINVEYTQPFFKKIVKIFGGYFNSGMMLLNLYLLRKNNLSKSLMNYRTNGVNFFMDQDTLNVTFRGHVKWLEPKYNFIVSNFLFEKKKVENLYGVKIPNGIDTVEIEDTRPVILHITGVPKPWDDKRSMAYPIYKKFKDDIK